MGGYLMKKLAALILILAPYISVASYSHKEIPNTILVITCYKVKTEIVGGLQRKLIYNTKNFYSYFDYINNKPIGYKCKYRINNEKY
jgi:hypothetical protein